VKFVRHISRRRGAAPDGPMGSVPFGRGNTARRPNGSHICVANGRLRIAWRGLGAPCGDCKAGGAWNRGAFGRSPPCSRNFGILHGPAPRLPQCSSESLPGPSFFRPVAFVDDSRRNGLEHLSSFLAQAFLIWAEIVIGAALAIAWLARPQGRLPGSAGLSRPPGGKVCFAQALFFMGHAG